MDGHKSPQFIVGESTLARSAHENAHENAQTHNRAILMIGFGSVIEYLAKIEQHLRRG
jgi:hypothetical protein